MTTFLPKEVQDGLDAARLAGLRTSCRLKVRVAGIDYPVLRLRSDGFSVDQERVPALRGLVDLFDGSAHLYRCLIVACEAEAGVMRYEFKRSPQAPTAAPLDYYRDPQAPAGLLPRY